MNSVALYAPSPNGRTRHIGHYDPTTRTWFKDIKDRNLMLAYGKAPGWQAETYDSLPDLEWLEARCDNGVTFRIDRKTFDDRKDSNDYGYGVQYFVHRRYWQIIHSLSTAHPQQRLL